MSYPYRQRRFYAGFYLAGEGASAVWCQVTSGFYPGGLPAAMREQTERAARYAGASRAQIIAVDFEAEAQAAVWTWEGESDGGDGPDRRE